MSKTKADDLCQVRCFNTELVTQLRETLPSEDTLEEMTVIFGALADRSRIKILYALRNGDELCVCDIAAMLNRIYFENRSFSSSGSRCFLTHKRSLTARGVVLI